MIDYGNLAALTAVVRTGSFDRAAARLNVTPSAISQRIRALEDQIGTTLVVRSQPATATATGQRLVRHAEDVTVLEAALGRDLDDRRTQARVRLAVNADSLATWFLPALFDPEGFLFDLTIDDQDYSADWLRRGEVMAAVTSTARAVAGCDAVPLGALRYVATASPAFAARWFGCGVTARALAAAPALTFDPKDRLQKSWVKSVTGATVELPAHYLPDSQGFVTAARAGMGWGMNPEPLVRRALADGSLIDLASGVPLDTPLYWQVSRLVAPALAALTASVRAAARAELHAP